LEADLGSVSEELKASIRNQVAKVYSRKEAWTGKRPSEAAE